MSREVVPIDDSIKSIGSEIDDLQNHKDVISSSIDKLVDSANENNQSAETTAMDVEKLVNIVADSNTITEKLVKTSDKLVGYAKKFSSGKAVIQEKRNNIIKK